MCKFYKTMNVFFGELGVLMIALSVLVLFGSLLFAFIYLFFNGNKYYSIDPVIFYILFWITLIYTGILLARNIHHVSKNEDYENNDE